MPRDMFGDVNDPSVKVGTKQWYTVPLSILAHFVVLFLLVVIPLLATDALPDVPTFAELGLAGFEDIPYYGIFAPAGTPAAAIEKRMLRPSGDQRGAKVGLLLSVTSRCCPVPMS